MHSAALRRDGLFDGNSQHPTAAEIFEAVNRVDPRCSRATSYNNLRDLVEAGLVREVAVEGRAPPFDAKGMQHHHFICDKCGNVEDMDWYDVPMPALGSLGNRIRHECVGQGDEPRSLRSCLNSAKQKFAFLGAGWIARPLILPGS
jgi:hypothetical protein